MTRCKFLLVCFALSLSHIARSQLDSVLIDRLDTMYTEDQKWRGIRIDIANGKTSDFNEVEAIKGIQQADSAHYLILLSVFEKYGFPGYDIVGETGAHHFWILVQHQDAHPEFQQQVLEAMKTEVDKGNAPKNNYAYLVDRVMLKREGVQLYGTQMTLNAEGTSFTPEPLHYPDQVDVLRKSMGLPPMDYYIQVMNERYYGDLKSAE